MKHRVDIKKIIRKFIGQDFSFHLKNNSAELITRIRTDSVLIKSHILTIQIISKFNICPGNTYFLITIEPLGFAVTTTIFLVAGSTFYFLSSKKSAEIGKTRQQLEILRTRNFKKVLEVSKK